MFKQKIRTMKSPKETEKSDILPLGMKTKRSFEPVHTRFQIHSSGGESIRNGIKGKWWQIRNQLKLFGLGCEHQIWAMCPTHACFTFSMFFYVIGGSLKDQIPIPMSENVSDMVLNIGTTKKNKNDDNGHSIQIFS